MNINETTDKEGRFVANAIIGTLKIGCSGKIFLFNAQVLEKANYSTIAKLFDKSKCLLWPESLKHDDVRQFLINATS